MNAENSTFCLHGLEFDPSAHKVSFGGESLLLTKTEFGTLLFLVQNAGITFSRQQIIAAVQGPDYPATDRTVDVQIVALRKKLGTRGKTIETVRGEGYRFSNSPAQ